VYRDAARSTYRSLVTFVAGQSIRLLRFPNLEIAVDQIIK